MNKKSEMFWTILLLIATPCKPGTVCTFQTGSMPVTVLLWRKMDQSVQLCPFYWHITTFSWSKTALSPTRQHLLVAFEASVGDILQRSSVWKGTSVQGRIITPYCTTSKTAWWYTETPLALLHQWCFYIFLYRTALLLSFLGVCRQVDETFTLKGVLIYSKGRSIW